MRNAWWLGQTSVVSPMIPLIVVVAMWSIFWTGLTLWHAARRGDKGWFMLFLLVHTAGVFECFYLFFIARIFEATRVKKLSKHT